MTSPAPGLTTRAGRTFIRALLRTPLERPILLALRAGGRRLPGSRALKGCAWHAGELLAEQGRVLTGRLNSGSRIYLLARDHVHRHIYFHGEFEPPTTRFLRTVARPGWTFVDVGANVGYYSLLAADLGGSGSQIHGFEPNPEVRALFERAALRHKSARIVPTDGACDDRIGTAELHLSPAAANSGLSTLRAGVLPPSAPRRVVDLVTLDSYCAERHLSPDVVKIDVEGHELAVLRGARQLLERHIPHYVICEVEPQRVPAEPLLGFMRDLGYGVWSLGPDGDLCPAIERAAQNLVFVAPAGVEPERRDQWVSARGRSG